MNRAQATSMALETGSGRAKRRRRCDNCGELFPRTKRWKRFCDEGCKREFHRHGSAFGPLKERLTKLVNGQVEILIRDRDLITRKEFEERMSKVVGAQ